MTQASPPAGAVDAGRLDRLLVHREQPREEEDDPEAELAPDDHDPDRQQRQLLAAEPVEREPVQVHRVEDAVERAVQLEDVARDDADDRHREDVRQEQDAPVDPPAARPFVEQHREEDREHEQHRHREEQQRAVLQRVVERRVLPHEPVVQRADVRPVRAADQPGREVDDAHHGIREDEAKKRHRRGDVDVRDPGSCAKHQEPRRRRAAAPAPGRRLTPGPGPTSCSSRPCPGSASSMCR